MMCSYVFSFAWLSGDLVQSVPWKTQDKTIYNSELWLCFVCEIYNERYAVANFSGEAEMKLRQMK